MEYVKERFDRWMADKEPLDNNFYWGNMLMLLLLTLAVGMYLYTPTTRQVTMSFETVLILLVVAGYSLIVFNQTELLRRRLNALVDENE